MNLRTFCWLVCAAALVLAGGCLWLPLGEPEVFEHAQFSFKLLGGWQAREGPAAGGKNASNYMMMDLNILAEAKGGDYTPCVTIASRTLPAGSNLEQEMSRAYARLPGRMRAVAARSGAEIDGAQAVVQRYEYPLGEPWYAFKDTWLVKNEQVYLIACQTRLNPSDSDLEGCKLILNSLHFAGGAPPGQ
jgi:hypothetical protein